MASKFGWCEDTTKAQLKCGHVVSKKCLLIFVLKSFLKKKQYEYFCLCLLCNTNKKLQSLILDCGCTWINIGENISNSKKIIKDTL